MLQRGMDAIGSGGDRRNQGMEKFVPAGAAAGDIGAPSDLIACLGIADIGRGAARGDSAFVRKRQAPLPREISAQNIGQLRAVRVKMSVGRIRVAEGISGTLQASIRRVAARSSDRQNELAVLALIGFGPTIGADSVVAPC